MTYLALYFSRYINGVAMHHSEISHDMFPKYPINSITNGVHADTWTCTAFQGLYDKHFPEWRGDSVYLRYAIGIPLEEIREAHKEAKQALLDEVGRRSGVKLKPEVMTIGFARRAAAYKRADLVFSDIERLKHIARDVGPFQMIFGGKAHPQDEAGKQIIRNVFKAARELGDVVPVVYLEEYDMELAKLMTSGVDLWLNTPQKPQEASGTSGMKATLNGVPNFSVLDGWWIEGHVDGETGWSITDDMGGDENLPPEVFSLYHKLEHVILPMFYGKPEDYESIMRTTISLNGSFFNSRRMLNQYLDNAYPIRKRYERHE
jgi:starch phosphorylase